MTFTTIAALLADPVLGKLEDVKRLLKHEADYEYTQPCYWRAALLAVANATGTCGECVRQDNCPIYDAMRADCGNMTDFGCSLFERKDEA